MDRSQSVNAAVGDTERTLGIAVVLVIGVVFVFLLSARSTLIPAVALPLSIIGTFGPMYLTGYSIDNLSLMALTIGTGFVVDDAVVVLENIMRHLDSGLPPREAALRGSREVGFTVMSMSLSLIAVFIPILLMPGTVGLLFHEFAVTLSMAILISMVISLTITPCMCAHLLKARAAPESMAPWAVWAEAQFGRFKNAYARGLKLVLDRTLLVGLVMIGLIIGNLFLRGFSLRPSSPSRIPASSLDRSLPIRPSHSRRCRKSLRSCRTSSRRTLRSPRSSDSPDPGRPDAPATQPMSISS